MPSTAVRPESILKDLARLWTDLGKEDNANEKAGVLRACAMTLIMTVEEKEDTQAIGETLAELMHEHPSRAIVIRVHPAAGATLEARVLAQCWMPLGRRQQICCEQIEITSSLSQISDLPKIIIGLTVPDLPVVVWCPAQQLAEDSSLQQLFSLADKLIVDSGSFSNPVEGIAFVRQLYTSGRNVADLAWTRLTPWRETIAQIFENPRNLEHIRDIGLVRITHGGAQPPVEAHYLASWFKHTLPMPVRIEFKPEAGGGILVVALEGGGFSASVAGSSGSCACLEVNGVQQSTAFSHLTDTDLLREELSIIGPDPIFRRCLE